jgi:hypothetical protein
LPLIGQDVMGKDFRTDEVTADNNNNADSTDEYNDNTVNPLEKKIGSSCDGASRFAVDWLGVLACWETKLSSPNRTRPHNQTVQRLSLIKSPQGQKDLPILCGGKESLASRQ